MERKWKLGLFALVLATALGSMPEGTGAEIRDGPCSGSYSLFNPASQTWGHSFGDDRSGYIMDPDLVRDHSHWGFSYGYLSSAQHPAEECDQDGGGEN